MKEKLDLIQQICGIKPVDQELIEISSDPNFIFDNDPNFPSLRLFDVDGNIINGGWNSAYYSGIKSELIFLSITIFYSFGYFVYKKRKSIKNVNKK